ncbi:Protein of unknown function (DUF2835) [Methylophaga frappieri]|uniref:DUF2835 domain-containing protein n=1 Tax=Methylophaga frappieri (strain ATCC BAA-2434 / DSM 25690 / JAM7) TaxID=754477 RepID=I1YEI4_METFJ|nr:DUF2835 domain-containing protein [Methylophaga frappieri]AFJ01327.1 Protein of unknown function (DUF2835) [Methylophaga frappieri]
MDNRLTLKLAIDTKEAMRYYRGEVLAVWAVAENGQSVQFPASHLRQYIDQQGVHGRFSLVFDSQFKLRKLERLSD